MERCRWCDAEVDPTNCYGKQSGKLFCNKLHSGRWYYKIRKQKEEEGIIPEPPKIKRCLTCNTEMLLTKKYNKKYCNIKCRKQYHNTLINHDEDLQRILAETKVFIHKLKKKSYWADMADIFQLIHFHSIVYPGRTYEWDGVERTKEELFNIMLLDLIKFTKREFGKK
jgi:hypothetical protein